MPMDDDDVLPVPDALQLGWVWDPFADGGPRWMIKAHWRYHHHHVECEWQGDTTVLHL